MSVPLGFSSAEEWEQWQRELHAANDALRSVAERAERRREELLAGAVSDLGGGILGTALPAEVRDALGMAKRIEGFLPFVPSDAVPEWARKLAEILALVARALGV